MKVKFISKKWEPKDMDNPKVHELQNNVPKKLEEKMSKVLTTNDKNHQGVVSIFDKHKEKKGMIIDVPSDSSIDILVVLSQITVKVPLAELLRIPEHQNKAIAWVGGVNEKVNYDCNKSHIPKDNSKEKVEEKETEGVISQNTQMILDNSIN